MVDRIIRSLALLALAALAGFAWWEYHRAEGLAGELAHLQSVAEDAQERVTALGADATARAMEEYKKMTDTTWAEKAQAALTILEIDHAHDPAAGPCRLHPDLWRMLQGAVRAHRPEAAPGTPGDPPPGCAPLADWLNDVLGRLRDNGAGLQTCLAERAVLQGILDQAFREANHATEEK